VGCAGKIGDEKMLLGRGKKKGISLDFKAKGEKGHRAAAVYSRTDPYLFVKMQPE